MFITLEVTGEDGRWSFWLLVVILLGKEWLLVNVQNSLIKVLRTRVHFVRHVYTCIDRYHLFFVQSLLSFITFLALCKMTDGTPN